MIIRYATTTTYRAGGRFWLYGMVRAGGGQLGCVVGQTTKVQIISMIIRGQKFVEERFVSVSLLSAGVAAVGLGPRGVEADNLSQFGGSGPGAVRVARGHGPRVGGRARGGEVKGVPVPREDGPGYAKCLLSSLLLSVRVLRVLPSFPSRIRFRTFRLPKLPRRLNVGNSKRVLLLLLLLLLRPFVFPRFVEKSFKSFKKVNDGVIVVGGDSCSSRCGLTV